MQYALVIYETADRFADRSDPARQGAYWSGWMAYSQAIAEAGIMRGGAPLQPPDTAATVRTGEARRVQDGPFADTKEQLGGFFLIEVASQEEALAWAARAPDCTVEVRPVLARESMG